ncbi:MAG: hypothetical protein J0H68_01525 [Sphingobacteriia bacterium]|nr:hypothetical protein [Sphingobacteriia bacterium]
MAKTRISYYGIYEDIIRELISDLVKHPLLKLKGKFEIEEVIYSDGAHAYLNGRNKIAKESVNLMEQVRIIDNLESFFHAINIFPFQQLQSSVEKALNIQKNSLDDVFEKFMEKIKNRSNEFIELRLNTLTRLTLESYRLTVKELESCNEQDIINDKYIIQIASNPLLKLAVWRAKDNIFQKQLFNLKIDSVNLNNSNISSSTRYQEEQKQNQKMMQYL